MGDSPDFRIDTLTGKADAVSFVHEDRHVCAVPRQRPIQVMRRNDAIVRRSYALRTALLTAAGALAFLSIGAWAAAPAAFLVHGVLYGSCAESRFHECLHGTPFRSRAVNGFSLVVLGFMSFKNPRVWR